MEQKKTVKKEEGKVVLSIGERLANTAMRIKNIQKEEKKSGMQYRFVSHDAVASAIHDELFANGIYITPRQVYSSESHMLEVVIRFSCTDNANDFIESNCFAPIQRPNDPKDFGSSYSYAYKYILLKTFMLSTGDDDIELADMEVSKSSKKITNDQIKALMSMVDNDQDFIDRMLNYLHIAKIQDMPADRYDQMVKNIQIHTARKKTA